jgi:DNA-binding PadR family transcriptional regulator
MAREPTPTTADVLVLSMLSEQPMHGHHLNRELERRQVRDWAEISRAQVYYSLDKLHRRGWIDPVDDDEPAAGPERQRYRTSRRGKTVLSRALDDEEWATQRDRPAFLTWLALSMHTKETTTERLVARRRRFLEAELGREVETLAAINADTPHVVPEEYFVSTRLRANLMVELTIELIKTELAWLARVEDRLGLC